MDEEKKGGNPDKFGKIIDTLHNQQKLPSLRTYQGDMAEFIKEKNESVVSITVKAKEKKERIEKEEEKLRPVVKSKKEGFQKNLIIATLSLVLLASGVAVSFYIFNALKKEPMSEVAVEEKVIPYNNLITLTNITKENFDSELAKLSPSNGASILKISDKNGLSLQTTKDFFGFLGISLPATLERTIKEKYAVGIMSQNNQTSYFLVITISDFGRAFSGMLDWDSNMEKDLSFMNARIDSFAPANTTPNIPPSTAPSPAPTPSSTARLPSPEGSANGGQASTTLSVKIPMKLDSFIWKDMIVKNKDTRALINQKNQAKIAYTFLYKNTILITSSLSSIGDIYTIYASRSIVR